MKLKDLYEAVKLLNQTGYYLLNDSKALDTNMLGYNRKNNIWEYYFLDERGGKSQLRTFATEEEACEYALRQAISSVKIFTNSDIDTVERRYLGKPMPPVRQPTKLYEIFDGIQLLNIDRDNYINDPDQDVMVCTSQYNQEKKKWEYIFYPMGDSQSEWMTFDTEEEVRKYVINEAVKTIREFGDAWINAARQKNK